MLKNIGHIFGMTGRSKLKRLLVIDKGFTWSKYAKFLSTSKSKLCHFHGGAKSVSDTSKRPTYFITTPIFYVNAAPHIGHMYTAFLTDTVARWYRLLGYDVIFTTGTDEHGLKIQQAASQAIKEPKIYCNEVSDKFKNIFLEADISYTDYIRTTEDRHIRAVQEFWKRLEDKGHIYKGSYEGWYSISDEAFMHDRDVKDVIGSNGNAIKVSVESEQPVIWMKEDNYMFRLSKFADKLSKWYDEKVLYPQTFEKDVRKRIENIEDLSISREKSRLYWGVPVPGDETQTVYVWLDALVNYLTVIGYPNSTSHWPADCHVVGKDILTFHAVYWPAFLMAAELPLPRQILCHSHWLVDGNKMSKSRGNVVDPVERMSKYTPEGLKFYLLSQGVPSDDGNYVDSSAVNTINSQLVNTYANLLSRSCGAAINPSQTFPALSRDVYMDVISEKDRHMFERLIGLADIVDEHYRSFNIYKAIDVIFDHLRWANKVFNDQEPWNLVKSEDTQEHLNCVLHIAMETLRVCSILLQPVVPKFSNKVLNKLNISSDKRQILDTKSYIDIESTCGHKLSSDKAIIMKRVKE